MSDGLRFRVDARPSAGHPLHLRLDTLFPQGAVSALFGPTGAGKTTALRALAGLEPTLRTATRFAGMTWQNEQVFVPPHARNAAFVFQHAALFPHWRVAQNLQFAQRRALLPRNSPAIDALLATLSIEPLMARWPGALSGGERQRVALARALLRRSQVLLLDEPLSALDDVRRQSVMHGIERLCHEDGVTVVFVSHAIDEIARLADHVVVLANGECLQQGSLDALTASTDVQGLLEGGRGSVLHGILGQSDTTWHLQSMQLGDSQLWLPQQARAKGANVRVRILAKDVSIALNDNADTSILNRLPVRIESIDESASPSTALIALRVASQTLHSTITKKSLAQLGLQPGQYVFAQIKSVALLA